MDQAVSPEEPMLVMAPATNEEGIQRALQQINRLKPNWTVEYDRRQDTLYVRAPEHGPAIAYWWPPQPEILFRLDALTGELTGIDLTHYRRILAPNDPVFRSYLAWYRAGRVVRRIPVLRRVKSLRNLKRRRSAQLVEQFKGRLCPT